MLWCTISPIAEKLKWIIQVSWRALHPYILLLSGQPLNEPIYGRGYFVMNTFTEVLQAYEDLKQGHFIAPNTKPNATDET